MFFLSILEILLGAALALLGSVIVFLIESWNKSKDTKKKYEPHFFLVQSISKDKEKIFVDFIASNKLDNNLDLKDRITDIYEAKIVGFIQNSSESSFSFKKVIINENIYLPNNCFVDKSTYIHLLIEHVIDENNKSTEPKCGLLFIEDLLGNEYKFSLLFEKSNRYYISNIKKH